MRLAGITYPQRLGGTTRFALNLLYGGEADSVSEGLSRITGLTATDLGTMASYSYAGTSRRVGLQYANGNIRQTVDNNGYVGLDRFGRVKDLHYLNAAGTATRYRSQYGYNSGAGGSGCGCQSTGSGGDRMYARVTQASIGATHDNDRSWGYQYDKLHRLIDARMGQLAYFEGAYVILQGPDGGAPIPRTTSWNLDNLGNWTGNPEEAAAVGLHRMADWNGNGQADDAPRDLRHVVNQANEIAQTVNYDELTYVPAATVFIHDPAGNLVWDGQFVYQYDGFNRLIQVNEAGTDPLAPNGQVTAANQLGALVCRYTYDGLGRLICKENAIIAGDPVIQRKDLYYDGVRRIQEVIDRPIVVTTTASQPDPGDIENDESPAEGEAATSQPTQEPWTDREYVYGPDYVDEFVCQIAPKAVTPSLGVLYMLQDANYNVVALSHPGSGNVVEQYAYEPYGEVVARDYGNSSRPVNRVGHQGLFFERFDGEYTQPTIAPGVAGIYYNRARFYGPQWGRFTSRDPNETGMPILAAISMNADTFDLMLQQFRAVSLYGDGMNLYLYLLANPVNRHDPSGLAFTLTEQGSAMGLIVLLFAAMGIQAIKSIDGGVAIFRVRGDGVARGGDGGAHGGEREYRPDWECAWGLAWCKWAVRSGYPQSRRAPRGWPRGLEFADCAACYATCRLSGGIWPNVGKCKLGGGLYNRERGLNWPDSDIE
jgi:RHS repeat-associated protein